MPFSVQCEEEGMLGVAVFGKRTKTLILRWKSTAGPFVSLFI